MVQITTAWAANGRDVEKIEGPLDPKQLKDVEMNETNWSKKTGDDGARIKEDSIRLEWHISDVKENHDWLTDDQCRDVLHEVALNHNADIGVNWDVLATTVLAMFPDGDLTC